MPSLDLDQNDAKYQVHGYLPGELKINDKTVTRSVIITPQELILDWAPQTVDELTEQSLEAILTLHPDVLLIGTGTTLVFPALSIYGNLINHGIGVEIMDTSAACRTYNALSAENRRVAAALIIR